MVSLYFRARIAPYRDYKLAILDPLLYIHHVFIDRLWWKWQSENLDGRLYQLGCPTAQGGTEDSILDYVITTYGIGPNVTVKEAMDIQGGFLCYKYDY